MIIVLTAISGTVIPTVSLCPYQTHCQPSRLTPHQSPYTSHQIDESALDARITSCTATAECGLGYCVRPSNYSVLSASAFHYRRAEFVGRDAPGLRREGRQVMDGGGTYCARGNGLQREPRWHLSGGRKLGVRRLVFCSLRKESTCNVSVFLQGMSNDRVEGHSKQRG